MKVGDIYYCAMAFYDEETGKVDCSVDEFVLRSIKTTKYGGKKAYYVKKEDGLTWVKSGFGKNATWSWASYIPKYCRRDRLVPSGHPDEFGRSVSQAWRILLASTKDKMEKYYKDDPELMRQCELEIAAIKRRITLAMTKKRAANTK